jgi:hypothetical protein
VIERWRRFFGRTNDGLSRDEQLGLVGELWLLLEWLPAVTVAAVDAWRGPLGGRHDWVSSAGLSVEVKTTGSSTGPAVHRVGRLDQLDEPPGGRLYLLSVRVIADASGQHSLDALLERARAAASAAGPTCATLLDDRLRALDLTQADVGRYREPLRAAQAELFEVRADFPRLVPGSFPTGCPPASRIGLQPGPEPMRPLLLATRPADTQVLARADQVSAPAPGDLVGTAVRTYDPRVRCSSTAYRPPTNFTCWRCGSTKTSKLVTVVDTDRQRLLCNGCYGQLLSLWEIKSGDLQTRTATGLSFNSSPRASPRARSPPPGAVCRTGLPSTRR